VPKKKPAQTYQIIPTDTFAVCRLDGFTLETICKLYTRYDVHPTRKNPAAYRLDKFALHLKRVHEISLKDYCQKFKLFEWPKCPISGEEVGYRIDGRGIQLSCFKPGCLDTSSPQNQAFYKKMSEDRKGSGNPMYGKISWSRGLTSETDERLRVRGLAQRGKPVSEERRQKSRENYQKNKHKFHHRMPHSEATKEKARINTARLWAEGVFKRTSSIHIKMREFLQTLSLTQPFVEEFQVKYFSMDFAFPEIKLAIEVQGSYYHVDPRFYPNGPENAMQRRNWGRDTAKRKVCCDQERWTIIEAWEPEINNGLFKNDILCKLRQYGLLASSDGAPPSTSG
jgi:hypothetical protein